MSNGRKPRDPLAAIAALTKGRPIRGGCDDCLAEQTLERHAPGVYVLTVHHDPTCPKYLAMTTRPSSSTPPSNGRNPK